MADILYDTRLKSEEAPKVIILTHGDVRMGWFQL